MSNDSDQETRSDVLEAYDEGRLSKSMAERKLEKLESSGGDSSSTQPAASDRRDSRETGCGGEPPKCPECGSDLEANDKEFWGYKCSDCDYLWSTSLVESTEEKPPEPDAKTGLKESFRERLPTTFEFSVLECDECGSIANPETFETYRELKETSCAECDFGKLKPERLGAVQRSDVLKLFGELINDFEELGPSLNYDSAMYLVHEYRQKIAGVEKKNAGAEGDS